MILEKLGVPLETMDVLKDLHEHTRYRVKGNAGLSDEWLPARGLSEGCATSPILFNLYHAVTIVQLRTGRTVQKPKGCKPASHEDGYLETACRRSIRKEPDKQQTKKCSCSRSPCSRTTPLSLVGHRNSTPEKR